MAVETLTPELEISATRQDVESAGRLLASAAYWMKAAAGVPQAAPIGFAQAVLAQRVDCGDTFAKRRLDQFEQAATAYEGARVALAELIGAEEPAIDDAAIALTGDDARAMREAMARYATSDGLFEAAS